MIPDELAKKNNLFCDLFGICTKHNKYKGCDPSWQTSGGRQEDEKNPKVLNQCFFRNLSR